MPRAVGEKPGGVPSTKPTFSWPGRRGDREVLRGVVASLSAAARGVSDTLPSNRAKCSLRGALRGGSAASGSACIGRRAGRYGESAALPRWAEVKPGFPHVVRIRTDIFLRRGKCPGCRVRWGETGRSTFHKTNLLLVRAAPGAGKSCAGRPRPCPPPHAAFRTLCPQTGRSVRSEAHYAAAVPRLARPASGGEPCKTGERAALFLLCPPRRPLAPSAALC